MVQIFSHPPGGILTLGNCFHADLKTNIKSCVSRSFCERNCFGQWVVRRIPALITQICTRTLHCTQVILHTSRNLECQAVMPLALWWEWRQWLCFIVSFLMFLLLVTTRQNFKSLGFPPGSTLNQTNSNWPKYIRDEAGEQGGVREGAGISFLLPAVWFWANDLTSVGPFSPL